MASGNFVATITSKDGSAARIRLDSETNDKYRRLFAVSAITPSQTEQTTETVETLFDGNYTVAGAAGEVTATVDLYHNPDSGGQRLLRTAHDAKSKVRIQETLLGDRLATGVAGTGLSIDAATTTAPYGAIDVSAAGGKPLRDAIQGRRGVTIKSGTNYYFVENIVFTGGEASELQIGVAVTGDTGATRPANSFTGTAVGTLGASLDIFGVRTVTREWVGLVTAVPLVSFSADAAGGLNTGTASFTFDDLPTETIADVAA